MMTIPSADASTGAASDLVERDQGVLRSAFYAETEGNATFCWLHRPTNIAALDHGVVICSPVGYEQIHSHRGLRHLADHLAKLGFPTMRFDWNGTGDSPGSDEDPDRVQTWLANVRHAATWMREQLGCRKVTLLGLRLGGTLAAVVASEFTVDNLILWAPIQKGRTYVREMRALSLTSDAPKRESSVPSTDIESAGFCLTEQTATELGTIDLGNVSPKAQRTLVISRDDIPEEQRLHQRWINAGLSVEALSLPGYIQMMAEPHRNEVPHQAIADIGTWLLTANRDDSRTLEKKSEAVCTSSIAVTSPVWGARLATYHTHVRESICHLNRHPGLFGILTEPRDSIDPTLPLIVLLNAGSAHRVGPNRLNVAIARRMAEEGFRCLRMDLHGLGDSISEPMSRENDPYPDTAFRDIRIVLNLLQKRFEAHRIVLMGLCSGAYAAFQAAAQFPDQVLVESVLINPLTFYWEEGMTLEESPTKELRDFDYYRRSALDPMKWVKLLTGQSKIGFRGAATMVANRLKSIYERATTNSVERAAVPERPEKISHPDEEDLPGDLRRIAGFGRKLTMFFSASDPGFNILNFHAKKHVKSLRSRKQLKIEFIEEADHTFTIRSARWDLIDGIAKHLRERYE